jgi:hypothetical protein
VTLTPTIQALIDNVTAEERAETRALIERGVGSPYNRSVLAVILHAERRAEKADVECKRMADAMHRQAEELDRIHALAEGKSGQSAEVAVRKRIEALEAERDEVGIQLDAARKLLSDPNKTG